MNPNTKISYALACFFGTLLVAFVGTLIPLTGAPTVSLVVASVLSLAGTYFLQELPPRWNFGVRALLGIVGIAVSCLLFVWFVSTVWLFVYALVALVWASTRCANG